MSIEQTIYNIAVKDGMPAGPDRLAEFIVAQSKHETGNYTHRFFTVGNNAFGYSYNKDSRWQLDKGGPLADNGVAIAQYRSVEDSVHEFTDWIKRRQKEGKFPADLKTITTPDQYAGLLKSSGYYHDTVAKYSAALSRWYIQVKSMALKYKKEIGLVLAAAALVGIGILIYTKRKAF